MLSVPNKKSQWFPLNLNCDPPFYLFIASMLIAGLWGVFSPFQIPIFLLFGLIVIAGFPHGIFDTWVYFSNKQRTIGHFVLFYLGYISVVFGAFLGFIYFPRIMITLFLFLSAWHFGRDYYPSEKSFSWLQVALGALLITSPVMFYPDDCVSYFKMIFDVNLNALLPLIWLIQVFTFVVAYIYRKQIQYSELLLLVFAAFLFEPLVYFSLYFICLHSLRYYSWALCQFDFSQQSEKKVVLATLFLMLLAFILMGTILFPQLEISYDSFTWSWIFYALGAFSLPHIFVVHIYSIKKLNLY